MKLSRISQPRLLYTEETSRENIQKIDKIIQKINKDLREPVRIPENYISVYNSLHSENPTDENIVSNAITNKLSSLFDLNKINRGLIHSDSEYYKDVRPDPKLITFLAPDNTQETYNAANQSLRAYYNQTMGLKFRKNPTEDILNLLNVLFEDERPVTDYRFYLALSRKIELMKMIYYYVMEEYVEQNKSSIMFLKYYQDENGKPLNIKKYPTIMYKLLEQNPGVEEITNVVRYCPKKLGAKLKEQINKLSNPLFVNYFNAIIKMFRDRVGSEPHEYFGAFKSALNKYH